MSTLDPATGFVAHAIQEWGDPPQVRVLAVQRVLDEAGFNAIATCWPVFGGIWPEPCTGPDGAAATEWLKTLTDTMPRGKVENEIEHVKKMIAERAGGA